MLLVIIMLLIFFLNMVLKCSGDDISLEWLYSQKYAFSQDGKCVSKMKLSIIKPMFIYCKSVFLRWCNLGICKIWVKILDLYNATVARMWLLTGHVWCQVLCAWVCTAHWWVTVSRLRPKITWKKPLVFSAQLSPKYSEFCGKAVLLTFLGSLTYFAIISN